MPRIKPEHKIPAPLYNSHIETRKEFSEKDDCAIRAIAAVTGAEYKTVLELCREMGREDGKATSWEAVSKPVLEKLGYKASALISPQHTQYRSIIDSYPGRHANLKHITAHHPVRFADVWAQFKGDKILFFTAGGKHVLALIDGDIPDWAKGTKSQVAFFATVEKAKRTPKRKPAAKKKATKK